MPKLNPRKRPVNMADLERVKQKAFKEAINEGYIKVSDLQQVLRDEYEIEV